MPKPRSEAVAQSGPIRRPDGGWRLDGSRGDEVDSHSPLTQLMYDTRREIRAGNMSPADCVRRFRAMGFGGIFKWADQWLDIESFYGWNVAYAATHAEGSLKLMYRHAPVVSDGIKPGTAQDAHDLADQILAICRERGASRKAEYDCLLVAGTVVGRGGTVEEAVRIIRSKLEHDPLQTTGHGASVPAEGA